MELNAKLEEKMLRSTARKCPRTYATLNVQGYPTVSQTSPMTGPARGGERLINKPELLWDVRRKHPHDVLYFIYHHCPTWGPGDDVVMSP